VADAGRLPFADDSFDVVVCCRLLHHLAPGLELERVTAELLRVSRGLVVASFWDATSWPGLRRARGWRRDETGRRPLSRRGLELAFSKAGGSVLEYAASLRFVSMQTFAAVRKQR
jgi:SAM-dependent methyltransferase